MNLYKVRGQTVRSPAADVTIPASLANIVNGVIGLDQSYVFVHTDHVVDTNAPPTAGFRNAPPPLRVLGRASFAVRLPGGL